MARAEHRTKAIPVLITPEEIGGIPILGALGERERERLSQSTADIRLVQGEFAVNEGDEAALFAVLHGRFEVVRTIDGVERVIGERLPGDIFGEVPIALGTGFPGAYRATEPSRVARIDVQSYHTIVAASPEVRAKVTALARR